MIPRDSCCAGSAWYAEAMRQMQQQSCMAAFDPRFLPWFYQAMSAMGAAGYNNFSAVGEYRNQALKRHI